MQIQDILRVMGAEGEVSPAGPTDDSKGAGEGTGTLVDPVGDKQDVLIGSVTHIMNGVIGVLGLVCVVVMIVGGVNYMTSAGDTNKVTKAKNTILYGLIGLVICVLAFAIVNFVIANIIGGSN